MSEEDTKRNSHWMGWTVTVALIPVVYVLTLPPIALSQVYDRKAGTFMSSGPKWMGWYAAPGDWLYNHVPLLKEPLEAYGDWWFKVYTGKSAP